MPPDATCSFCGQAAALEPSPTISVCWSCAKAIAKLARDSEPERIAEIWSLVAPPLRRLESKPVALGAIDIEGAFAKFKEGVGKSISATDADSRSNLAEAYREMGLYSDAIREAAIAVTAAVAPRSAEGPLCLLLTPPLLRPGGLERLGGLLRARAS